MVGNDLKESMCRVKINESQKKGFAKMKSNEQLQNAKKNKNDEFYTQLSDIENELKYYTAHFKDKTVLCNCDDPFESNFFKYFVLNFNRLGLKKLITTCYSGSPIMGLQLSLFDVVTKAEKKESLCKHPYKTVVTDVHDTTGDGGIDMFDVKNLFLSHVNELTELNGNGDFRSSECLALLDEADIVVTNPPFSLFREYVKVLMEHKKKFVIMGNKNAITYKEFFPFLKDNEVWVGATSLNGGRWMIIPKGIEAKSSKVKVNERGETLINVPGVCWFTNLDIKKRHEPLILYKSYRGHEEEYPKYDNYEAIEVSKVTDIPYDYFESVGKPVACLEKHNPGQVSHENIDVSCDSTLTFIKTDIEFQTDRQTDRQRIAPCLARMPKEMQWNHGRSNYIPR